MIDNYYILLGLDPDIQDAAKIEEAIVAKKNEWSRDRTNPAKSTQASKYLGDITKMRRTLLDLDPNNPGSRLKEADAAKTILQQQQKDTHKAINEDIAMLTVSKSHILTSEFEVLKKRHKLSESELKAIIKVPIKADKPDDKKSENIVAYDSSSMKTIARDLNVLNNKDLYDFLGMAHTSSLTALLDKTGEKDKEIKLKSAKDATVTAAGALIGHCKTIFKTEDLRKSYDKAVQLSGLEILNPALDIAGIDERIDTAEFNYLIGLGNKQGFDKTTVSDYIRKYSKQKKWEIYLSEGITTENKTDCSYCGTSNPSTAKFCSSCSLPFTLSCPDCGQENKNNARVCIKCRFLVGDMPNALPLIREGFDALYTGKVAEAETYFAQAERFWKNHPDIIKGKEQIYLKKKNVEASFATLQALTQQSHYYAAQEILRGPVVQFVTDIRIKTLKERIERGISEVETLIGKSKIAKTNQEKSDYLLEALRLCPDSNEAEALLATIPPDVPTGLNCRVESRLVSLHWAAVQSKETVSYRVVRKPNTAPNNANDGEIIGEIEQTFFQDSGGETGITYFYGVFTKRRQVLSSSGAVSNALMKIGDIERLQVIPNDKRLALKWETPSNVNRVEVWVMPDQIPTKRGEGKMLTTVQSGGANHEQLENDRNYGYLIVAIFKDIYGKDIFTAGMPIMSAPMAPPQANNTLVVSKNEDGFELTWQTKANEQVDIYCAEKPQPYKLGEILTMEDLKKCGRLLPLSNQNKTYFRPQGHGAYYFLPVTSKGNLMIAGHAESILHLEDVINLKGVYSEGLLRLEWIFPTGVKKVQISYGSLVNGAQIEVSDTDYQKERAYFIRNIDGDLWDINIKVKAILDTPTGKVYSKGTECTVRLRKTTIRFDVQKKATSWFSSTVKLNLSITKEGLLGNTLILVVKEHNKLISFKDLDRVDVLEIVPEAFHFSDFKAEIEYHPTGKNVKNLFFSLIPKNQTDKDALSIEDNGKKITL